MAAELILLEATPANPASGAAVTVRLAGGGASKPYHYDGAHWRGGIAGLPTVITSLDFEGGELGTGGVPSAAEIEWVASSRAELAELAGLMWRDAPVTVRVGPEGTLPPVLIAGKVLEAASDTGRLRISLADPAADLKKPLLTERFAGTGGLEGPAEWDGLIRRRVWGRVWNLRGDPLDKANNIYCFADPQRQLQEISEVRDKGAATASLSVLGWQGSAAATFAALQGASAPVGGGVAAPSIACVKWWTQPAGSLTADVKGEIGTGYAETTSAIAERLVQAIAGPAFAAGTVAAAASARPAPVGWVADSDTATVAAMLDELLGNSSLLWVLAGTGEIVLREWSWGSPVAAATAVAAKRKRTFRPLATRRLGYRRNELPMARGDLAAIVLEVNRWPDDPPTDVGYGSLYFDEGNRPHLFAGLDLVWNDDGLSHAGDPLVGSGYVDGRDDELKQVIDDLQEIDNDGVITIDEKIRVLIPENDWLEATYQSRLSQAAAMGITLAGLTTARAAWISLRNGLSPAWNDTTADSPITRSDWDTILSAYRSALETATATLGSATAVGVVPPPAQRVEVDLAGAVVSGQYPRTLTPLVTRGGSDIRDDDDVSYAITTSGITATVNNTAADPDKGKITATDGVSGSVALTVTVAGVAYGPFTIVFDDYLPSASISAGYATTSDVALKAPLASPAFTGTPTAPTAAPGTNTTQLATTAFVAAAVTGGTSGAAPLASPTFTGDPKAPTPASGDNDTSIATTAFARGEVTRQFSAETAWSPTITSSIGAFTTVSSAGYYLKVGQLVIFSVAITITDAGTAAGALLFNLPYAVMAKAIFAGRTEDATPLGCTGRANDAFGGVQVTTYLSTGATAIATGRTVIVSGSYIST